MIWMKRRRESLCSFTPAIRDRSFFSFTNSPSRKTSTASDELRRPARADAAAGRWYTLKSELRKPEETTMAHLKRAIPLPSMTPGTRGSIPYHRFGRAGARPKAYLQAAIHANELPGAMALHHLMPMLVAADRAKRIRGEIVVVPTVNPIGLSQLVGNNHLGRYDFVGRENFNRNWLDLSGPIAERVGDDLGSDARENVTMIRRA